MSEKIRKAILDSVVNPELNKKRDEINGEVIETYDEPNDTEDIDNYNINVVDVKVLDEKTGQQRVLYQVPITQSTNTSKNIDGQHLEEGDKVVIDFVNGNPLHPQVIGLYYDDPHQRKKDLETTEGVNIPDAYGFFG